MGAFYCAVCRKTDFSGKGHIYGKSHQSKLKVILVKFLEKIKEARKTVKNPVVEKYQLGHDVTFWCHCCARAVPRHVTDGNMSVIHGGTVEHLCTPEHRRRTHTFCWENKVDSRLREKFLMSQEECQSFKSEVLQALEQFEEKKDEFIQQHAEQIRSQERQRLEVQKSLLQPKAEREAARAAEEQRARHMTRSHGNEASRRDEPDLSATFIGYQESSSDGNVHTGAVPPWLQEEPEQSPSRGALPAGPSLQEFLKHKEQQKLRKLPARRVGANFQHSAHTHATWLPSFGRVWNSGRRWQSRHQFRAETRGQKRKHLSNGASSP